VAIALAGAAFALFAPALGYEFVNLDDFDYVKLNHHVLSGLTWQNVCWAFTTFDNDNWHPLTWLSLQLDATVWGTGPRGFHFTSLLLHAANAALLFLALRAMTGATWRSLAVALLFAVHPLRVESVSWISERKDVVSVFFGLMALWAYAGYSRRPSAGRLAAVSALFACSLLAKPMLVTLPCLLLVLDWWPLGRTQPGVTMGRSRRIGRLVLEKVPLFALAAISSVVTVQAQRAGGAVSNLHVLPPEVRVENAAISYVAYLAKTFWPSHLAAYYPHPALSGDGSGRLPTEALAAGLLLVAISVAAVALRRRAPYALAGWLWFLGTLVPTIGLVQVGNQAYADRYTYFPQIGILVAACWAVAELRFAWMPLVAAAAATALAVVAHQQMAIWQDSLRLWDHTVQTAGVSPLAMICRGEVLLERQRFEEAADCYRRAIALDPDSARAMNNLGICYLRQGKLDDAARCFEDTCRLVPRFPLTHLNLGLVRMQQNRFADAARECEAECRLDPTNYEGFLYLGQVQLVRNDLASASDSFAKALELRPESALAHTGMADCLLQQGRADDGLAHLRKALEIDPRFGRGHFMLATALESRGDSAGAAEHFELAARYSPDFGPAWNKLGAVRAARGRTSDSVACFARAVECEPQSIPFRTSLAVALDSLAREQARNGHFADAATTARRARDEALRAGQSELARQLEQRQSHYERGENPPASASGRPGSNENASGH
jgi:tetratricopeptide (TPR) repeat protein